MKLPLSLGTAIQQCPVMDSVFVTKEHCTEKTPVTGVDRTIMTKKN